MDKKEILEFMEETYTCYLATVEGNTPHVRAMGLGMADENGIVLQSWKIKDIYPQLCKNPQVELCFYDPKKRIQVRVSGKIEPVEDEGLIKQIKDKRPYLKPWLKEMGKGDEVLYIFILKHGRATVWTRKTNFAPKEYIQL